MRLKQALVGLGHLVVGLGCLALLTGCPSASDDIPQPKLLDPLAPYLHEPSGFRFPVGIKSYLRDSVHLNDREGQSVTVAYHLVQIATVTITVYPVPAAPDNTPEGQFQKWTRDFLSQTSGAKELSSGPVRLLVSEDDRDAQHAVFGYEGTHLGRRQPMRTELYLVRDGNWFVKYQAAYATADREFAEGAFKAMLNQFRWPADGKGEDKKDEKKEDKKEEKKESKEDKKDK
jgi:hypothetical protein